MDPLNQEQLDHYHHRGWVTLAGPFSPAHVASAAAAIGRMCPEAEAGSNQRSQASFSPSAAGGPAGQGLGVAIAYGRPAKSGAWQHAG